MGKIKAIISDSDGTLVDTLYLIRHGQYEAAVEYLTARGIPRKHIPQYEQYEDFINKSVGGPTEDTFTRTLELLFKGHKQISTKDIDFKELDASLKPIQDRIAPLYVHPFPGLAEFFRWIGKSDMSLGIFTSGSPHHIVRNYGVSIADLGQTELYKDQNSDDQEKLQSFIARAQRVFEIPKLAVVTCEDVSAFKPDPEGILQLIEKLAIDKSEVITLGDHPVDIEAAKRAGVHSIGLTHGFGSPAELKTAGALQTTGTLRGAMKIIDRHNRNEELLF